MSTSQMHPGKLPSNYKEVLYWKIGEKASRLVLMNLLSIPLALVSGFGFFIFVQLLGKPPKFTFDDSKQTVILFIGVIITIILHEITHGFGMRIFGARTKYSFEWKKLMIIAAAPGHAFQRNQYLVFCLAPLVVLSILACCGIVVQAGTSAVWFLAIWATINASMAIGDLWIAALALRYDSSAYIVDEQDGMRIFLPSN